MDVQHLWQVDMYQQNVFRRGRNEAENHIPNQNSFSFVSMRIYKNSNISVSRSDFDSGVSSSWMEFDFGFAIENSRSFAIENSRKRLFVGQIPRVAVYREMRNIYV